MIGQLINVLPWWFWFFGIAYILYIFKWVLVMEKDEPFLLRLSYLLSPAMFFFWMLDIITSNDSSLIGYLTIIRSVFETTLVATWLLMFIGLYQRIHKPDYYEPKRRAIYKFLKYVILFLLITVVPYYILFFT